MIFRLLTVHLTTGLTVHVTFKVFPYSQLYLRLQSKHGTSKSWQAASEGQDSTTSSYNRKQISGIVVLKFPIYLNRLWNEYFLLLVCDIFRLVFII